MTLQWVGADFRSGLVLADLPSLEPAYPYRTVIGQDSQATATLYLDGAPKGWERATMPAGSMLACYDDADPQATPQWVGVVWHRKRNTVTDTIDLSLSTAESYLARRDVGVYTTDPNGHGDTKPQNQIVAELIAQFVNAASPAGRDGWPLLVHQIDDDSTPRLVTYALTDQVKVQQRLQELSALDGGPEWTITWSWNDNQTVLIPTLTVGTRLGVDPPNGQAPLVVFDMPGNLRDIQMDEDYSDGQGANLVRVYSSGQGSLTPTSGAVESAVVDGRPVIDLDDQPAQSIDDDAALIQWANSDITHLQSGTSSLTLVADLATAPRFGQAWQLGDTIGYEVAGPDTGGNPVVRAFPNGLSGIDRAIGVELSVDTISPLLPGDVT